MTKIFKASPAFVKTKRKNHINIEIIDESAFEKWIKKQDKAMAAKASDLGFKGKAGQIIVQRDDKGVAESVVAGASADGSYFDYAAACDAIASKFADDVLKKTSFAFSGLNAKAMTKAQIGWGWACYEFADYKAKAKSFPALLLSGKDTGDVISMVESVNALRDLVNAPANDMGPQEIEDAVKALAKAHEAKVSVVKDQKQLEKEYPLVFTVGKASPRKPRLIDMKWGNAKHPKVTLVGKGVAFDTGGLDLKPSQYMRLMKKDMGGAAHTIALAKLIMDYKLPVRLRLIIPAVENAVAGEAFRPGDIIKSRKGIFVENTNTDAEGRLILADALALAAEENPEMIIDYATLTGSARAGLGPDIPALFSNNDKVAAAIQKGAEKAEDPVWAMPLWQPYRKHIEKSVGDLINSAGIPGDLIYSALFLESFVQDQKESGTDWVHLDCFAWEQTGKAGRPAGAADTGLRSVFAYLQARYG